MKKSIAVTGGIGSGKSTVLSMIEKAGYPVFSADTTYHRLMRDPNYIRQIQMEFPSVIVDGTIDKSKLGKLVFSDESARARLNAIAHPLVMERLKKEMLKCDCTLCFAEVPLLFEGNYQNGFDGVIVVTRPLADRVAAICKRDGIDESAALARIRSQFDYDSDEAKRILSKTNVFVIENTTTKNILSDRVLSVIRSIKSL